jgi:hypothetical protein
MRDLEVDGKVLGGACGRISQLPPRIRKGYPFTSHNAGAMNLKAPPSGPENGNFNCKGEIAVRKLRPTV